MKFTYQPGDQPLDGYTIRKPLGHGGFGEVYHAVSEAGKEVALKLVQRFLDVELRGVTLCLNLKHPNLVTIYDLRTSPADEHWIVMEFIDGPMLSEELVRHPQGLPEEEALRWLEGIAAGVGYLHEKGLVHRDLKPGNVFIEEGTVKVGDYGLSKFITVSRRSGQTQSVGTVHYMAPEIGSGRYGPEVDIYALGVMFYEMLTGDVPFDGETPTEILMKHLSAEPDLSRVPVPFQPVVGRMLAKKPEDRYGSVQDVLDDVRRFLADPALAATIVPHVGPDGPAGPHSQQPDLAAGPVRRPGPTGASLGGGVAQLGAVAQPRDVGTLTWLMPSSTRRRWGESLREHPILWPFCLFCLIALIVAAAVWDGDSGIFGRHLSRALFQAPTGGVYSNVAWAHVGWGAVVCAVLTMLLFAWRTNSPTPAMLVRQQRRHARSHISESLREHPALWTLCVFITLAVTGIPVFLLAWGNGLSGREQEFVMFVWMWSILGCTVLFCAWVILWRTVSPTERMLARSDDEVSAGFGSHIQEFFVGLRNVRRSQSDCQLGGVCGGLGEHTPIPSWMWRTFFLGLFFFAGSGIMIYLILWFCIPETKSKQEQPQKREDARTEATRRQPHAQQLAQPGTARRTAGAAPVAGQQWDELSGMPADPQAVLDSVRAPAIGLIVVGLLGLVAVVATMFLFVAFLG